MPASTVNGFTVGYTAVGVVLVFSGFKGWPISDTFQYLISGKQPPNSAVQTIGGGETLSTATSAPSGSGSTAIAPIGGNATENQMLAKIQASAYGWATGTEWSDLVNLWNRESGWNQNAMNPSSGAYGIAQALGHGEGSATQGTVTNQYGGYGLSDAQAKAANSGNAGEQIAWGLEYIKQTYGDPEAAWAHEESARWY